MIYIHLRQNTNAIRILFRSYFFAYPFDCEMNNLYIRAVTFSLLILLALRLPGNLHIYSIRKTMMIVTTPTIFGKRIVVTHGLVRGNTIRARHIGSDIGAVFKNMIGGEIRAYASLLEDSREEALQRMMKDAESLGANAIVSVRIATSVVMGGAAEMLAYGTAVSIEDDK